MNFWVPLPLSPHLLGSTVAVNMLCCQIEFIHDTYANTYSLWCSCETGESFWIKLTRSEFERELRIIEARYTDGVLEALPCGVSGYCEHARALS